MNQPDMAARTKEMLALQGRAAGIARHPILPVSDEVRAFLAATLERSGVAVHATA